MIDLSVIIPIHNTETYLRECLSSVKKLAKKIEVEVILVDDGSTDKSYEIAAKFSKEKESYHLYKNKSEGVSAARNLGIEKANGNYILFVDSDDVIVPKVYKEMLEIALAQDADMVRCNYIRTKWGSVLQSELNNRSNLGIESSITKLEDTPNLVYDTPCWNKLIRRRLLIEKEIFFPEGVVLNEDAPFMIKLFYYCNKCITVFKAGYLWRIRTDHLKPSATQNFNTDTAFYGKLKTMLECLEFLSDNGAEEVVVRKLIWKSLATEIPQFTANLGLLPKEEAENRIEHIREFIDKVITIYDLSFLPVGINTLINELRKSADLGRIIKMSNFARKGIWGCPIIYGDDSINIKLPEDLIGVKESSAAKEFVDVIPSIAVYGVEQENDNLIIRGHVFINRVQTCDEYTLKVDAFALDSINNTKYKLHTETDNSFHLTQDYGRFVGQWDHETYNYNYDRGGFKIYIEPKVFDNAGGSSGDISIHLKYENAICASTTVIRGVFAEARAALKKWKYSGEKNNITAFIDRNGALFLRRKHIKTKKKGLLKKALKRKYSIPVGKKHSITIKLK